MSLIGRDVTDLCGSGFHGILEDRHSGPTPGDRKLRSYSHTAADTANRGVQEDRLRTGRVDVKPGGLLNKTRTSDMKPRYNLLKSTY